MPWILIGIFLNSQILAYSWLNSQFPITYSGRISTAINLCIFAAGYLIQFAIGWIINFWEQTPNNNYSPDAYFISFGIFLILQIICVIIFLCIKADNEAKTV